MRSTLGLFWVVSWVVMGSTVFGCGFKRDPQPAKSPSDAGLDDAGQSGRGGASGGRSPTDRAGRGGSAGEDDAMDAAQPMPDAQSMEPRDASDASDESDETDEGASGEGGSSGDSGEGGSSGMGSSGEGGSSGDSGEGGSSGMGSSGEGGSAGGEPPQCTELALEQASGRISLACAGCFCRVDEQATLACDATCFDLGLCIVTECDGDATDFGCMVSACSDHFEGIVQAVALSEALEQCAETCGERTDAGAGDQCGDGVVTGDEECDGESLAGETCASLGYGGGTLRCDSELCNFDASGCSAECGDGNLDANEECDGDELGDASCESYGFESGALGCEDCEIDLSQCEVPSGWTCSPWFYGVGDGCDCGCGIADPDCEGDESLEACRYCDNAGSCSADARCPGRIDPQDSSQCTSTCGDQITQPEFEACDGEDHAGEDCESLGYVGGVLACIGCEFNTTQCVSGCGDGTIQLIEDCDGENLGGASCEGLGFASGSLACDACEFDVSDCEVPEAWSCPDQYYGQDDGCDCGCAIPDPDCGADTTRDACEVCSLPGSCSGPLTFACPGRIAPADNTECSSVCGDGVVNPGFEICDGADLDGASCATLGFTGGILLCDPDACIYDASLCTGGGGGVGGGGGGSGGFGF